MLYPRRLALTVAAPAALSLPLGAGGRSPALADGIKAWQCAIQSFCRCGFAILLERGAAQGQR
jgi:hypothetical protein